MFLIRLLLVLFVVVLGYWLYYVFAAADLYDPIGVAINEHMPRTLRDLSCRTLLRRHPDAVQEPAGCEHLWRVEL
ncbi:hypothetical protein MWN34_00175 [Ancylobacter sp. 6x-1]|uniref:Uncharacterized protein n=1 Tax=Ancylobacter crimeensis TaxID=2579147 RepID=A0ABT0D5W1_9HYPH|nr:hypothetical protein [Ancylobacter crimeensis]MCK0195324.1 hypothetical protein [Ancylobacter crimeensis]